MNFLVGMEGLTRAKRKYKIIEIDEKRKNIIVLIEDEYGYWDKQRRNLDGKLYYDPKELSGYDLIPPPGA